MAFSSNLSAYPPAFIELFESGLLAEGTFIIPCNTKAQADRTRMLFYGIKGAIKKAKEHPLRDEVDKKQIIVNKNNEIIFRLPSESPREWEGQSLLAAAKAANQKD